MRSETTLGSATAESGASTLSAQNYFSFELLAAVVKLLSFENLELFFRRPLRHATLIDTSNCYDYLFWTIACARTRRALAGRTLEHRRCPNSATKSERVKLLMLNTFTSQFRTVHFHFDFQTFKSASSPSKDNSNFTFDFHRTVRPIR